MTSIFPDKNKALRLKSRKIVNLTQHTNSHRAKLKTRISGLIRGLLKVTKLY